MNNNNNNNEKTCRRMDLTDAQRVLQPMTKMCRRIEVPVAESLAANVREHFDATAAEALRTFAVANGEVAFGHLVTAALGGEVWAMERVTECLELISDREDEGMYSSHQARLHAIVSTDTERPDEFVAKAFVDTGIG